MKKNVFLTMALALLIPAFSQVDTLQWNQLEPTYYYWDNHWGAYCGTSNSTTMYPQAGPSIILARYCYADTALKVIGVAAPSTKHIPRPDSHYPQIRYTADSSRRPEYFQLYEANDSGMILKAEARWDTNHPRYCMHLPPIIQDSRTYAVSQEPYVYEAYFDKPVVVHDSFYVAATTNNNDLFFNESTGQYEGCYYYQMSYFFIGSGNCPGNAIDIVKAKLTNPFDRDTNPSDDMIRMWQEWYDIWFPVEESEIGTFMAIFPIFDTTGLDIHGYRWLGICNSVRDLRLMRMDEGNAYIGWQSDTAARWWELSYGEPGVLPDDGIHDTCRTSLVCLNNLQPGQRYDFYVRERCKDDTRGPWTGPLSFTMAGSSDDIVPSPSVVDRHTHLMPNPTGGITSVISGFRISTIEVYNTAGALVESININGNSGVIDASHLPSGTYILRIRTSHGDTAKKLVRQ